MARKDALDLANTGAVGELNKITLRKIVNQIYDDMAGGGIQSVTLSEDFAVIDNTAIGDLSLDVDNTDPQNPVINLILVTE